MNVGKTLFAQVMEFVPWKTFGRIVERHKGDAGVRTLSCADLFRVSLFDWAPFRSTKAAVKLHTLLDLRGSIPTFIHIGDGKLHDVNVLAILPVEERTLQYGIVPGQDTLVDQPAEPGVGKHGLHDDGASGERGWP